MLPIIKKRGNNKRNSRTTFPRKAARRAGAAARFSFNPEKMNDPWYIQNKTVEQKALGLI